MCTCLVSQKCVSVFLCNNCVWVFLVRNNCVCVCFGATIACGCFWLVVLKLCVGCWNTVFGQLRFVCECFVNKEQRHEMMRNYFVSGLAIKSFGISTWRMFTMWKSTVCDIHMRWVLSGVSNSVCVFKLRDGILRHSFVSVWAFNSFEILNSLVMSRHKTQSEIDISFQVSCIFRFNINVVYINLSLISRLAHINMCNRNTDPQTEWMSFSVSAWTSSSSEIVQ